MPRLFTRPGLHTGGFYLAFYMATGALVPFWPLWFSRWGLTPGEVGVYTALGSPCGWWPGCWSRPWPTGSTGGAPWWWFRRS